MSSLLLPSLRTASMSLVLMALTLLICSVHTKLRLPREKLEASIPFQLRNVSFKESRTTHTHTHVDACR